jgi:histidine triad (HIT) family protein
MSENCLFCKIASGKIPAALVAENVDAIAFRDIDPKAPTHILVIPREHVASLADTTDERLLGSIVALCSEVARDAGIAESGYRLVANVGKDGGQSVDHLHFHIMGGRHMTWPPG